jgi:hypothetical protein
MAGRTWTQKLRDHIRQADKIRALEGRLAHIKNLVEPEYLSEHWTEEVYKLAKGEAEKDKKPKNQKDHKPGGAAGRGRP